MPVIKKKFTLDLYEVIYRVDEWEDNLRLDQLAAKHFLTFSREQIKSKIRKGEIYIIDRPGKMRPSTIVHTHNSIKMLSHKSEELGDYWQNHPIPQDFHPKIIFENEDILVISKPPFMATHPTGRHLFYTATSLMGAKYQQTIHSIHRIDRETSGLLILGKNPRASQIYSDFFAQDLMKKAYLLIAKNSPHKSFPFWANESLLMSDERIHMQCVTPEKKHSLSAYTYFEFIAEHQGYLFALAFPFTGRQHQIRAHAQHHHFPLLGDKIYASGLELFSRYKDKTLTHDDYQFLEIPRQALHAFALKFPEEVAHEKILIDEFPKDLQKWMQEKGLPFIEIHAEATKRVKKLFRNGIPNPPKSR